MSLSFDNNVSDTQTIVKRLHLHDRQLS